MSLTKEKLEKLLKELLESDSTYRKPQIVVGKQFLEYVYNEQGKEGLRAFLDYYDVSSGKEGVDFITNIFKDEIEKDGKSK